MKSVITILILALSIIAFPLKAEEKIGVLLMHGKWGTSSKNSPIGKLATALEGEGFLVSAPDMPWSRDRGLDKSYEESMSEIDGIVSELRSRGASKIVVGGHSIGANAAVGYGSRRDGLAGILAIAPGHIPEVAGFQSRIDNDWERAKEMVSSGKSEERAEFKDLNQGKKTEKDIQADIYLSWYDPAGPAVIPVNVAKLKQGTPLLWIIGEKDRMFDRGEGYAYSNAPSNTKNAYIVVKGGHKTTPQKGESEIINWLKNL